MISFGSEPFGNGLRVTRVSSTDRVVRIPGDIGGVPVVSIGPAFMSGCPSAQGRTLSIPGTVADMDPEALDGVSGIAVIEFGGDMATFSGFGIIAPSECTLRCMESDGPFEFRFPAGMPMAFPGFDEAALSSMFSMTMETAMARLSHPVMLTDAARDGYHRAVRDRVMPRAEQAVSSGDKASLDELSSAGMLDVPDLMTLLERSARSGRIPMTSAIMSMIRRKSGI